jgi:hypothetical protein
VSRINALLEPRETLGSCLYHYSNPMHSQTAHLTTADNRWQWLLTAPSMPRADCRHPEPRDRTPDATIPASGMAELQQPVD